MNFLKELVATPLARPVGWTLLHSLWEAAAISLVLAIVLAGTRSARARYTAACIAMLASIVATSFTFVRLIPGGMYGLRGTESLLLAPWNVQPGLGAGGSCSRVAAMVPWLAPVWMIGVWVFVLTQVAGWFSVSRLRIRGVCSAPERWQTELTRLRTQLRISRPVQLFESSLADIPVVIGHIRPVILVPIGLLSGIPAGQVEAILLHELAHVRRCDYLVNVMQRSVESLFFYNPTILWISHVIRTERDDIVVATSITRREYAGALAALERNRSSRNRAALAASGGNLMKRIRRLLYPSPAPALWAPTLAAAILVIAATVSSAAWPPKVLRRAAELAPAGYKSAHQSQYQKWLNEDVVYIITPKERAAFGKPKTNSQRNEFVQQFWERRNPHPGSDINTFK